MDEKILHEFIEKVGIKIIEKPNKGDVCLQFYSDGKLFQAGIVIKIYGKKIMIKTILHGSEEYIALEMNSTEFNKSFSTKFFTFAEDNEMDKLMEEFYIPERILETID